MLNGQKYSITYWTEDGCEVKCMARKAIDWHQVTRQIDLFLAYWSAQDDTNAVDLSDMGCYSPHSFSVTLYVK
jgi:hypothetical protein